MDFSLSLHDLSASNNVLFYPQFSWNLCAFIFGKNLAAVIHAFVTSRLDWCGSFVLKLNAEMMYKLLLIQQTAACLFFGVSCPQHFRPRFKSLPQLSVRSHCQFKVFILIFKNMDQAPATGKAEF